jgi:hypothetical protein
MGRNANVRLNAHLRRCPTVNRTGPVRIPLRKRPSADRHLGKVTGGAHREFAMASGEMSDAEFLAFNIAWIEAATAQLVEGGVFGQFDFRARWRGVTTFLTAAKHPKSQRWLGDTRNVTRIAAVETVEYPTQKPRRCGRGFGRSYSARPSLALSMSTEYRYVSDNAKYDE